MSSWLEFLILSLATWRTFQLVAFDDILDRPRRWALRLGDYDLDAPPASRKPLPEGYRLKWAQFITCPYCAGAWIAGVWWIAWQAGNDWPIQDELVFSIAYLVALAVAPITGHKLLARDEDK